MIFNSEDIVHAWQTSLPCLLGAFPPGDDSGLVQYQNIKLAGEFNIPGNDSGFLSFSEYNTNLQLALSVN